MATRVSSDAQTVLSFLAQYHEPGREDDAGHYQLDGDELNAATGLSPRRINDAVTFLEHDGLVEVLKYLGTAPFEFGSVSLTTRGRHVADDAHFDWRSFMTSKETPSIHVHVTGDGNALNVASPGATQAVASKGGSVGSLDRLKEELRSHRVDEIDIVELSEILVSEEPEGKALGPRVSGWMGKMVAKAARGLWPVSVGAAGGVLERIIGAYYGLQ